MKSTLFVFLLALTVALWVCLAADAGGKISIRTLAKGAFSGVMDSKQEVIKDQTAWEKFWSAHCASAKPAPPIPAVDFAKEMVIAVTMGKKNSGGYAIEITGVETMANHLNILVKRTSPAPGAITIAALTAPFHFVVVPKSDLRPEFLDTPTAERAK